MSESQELTKWQMIDKLYAQASEIKRLQAEALSLRASLGEPTGAEPIGCPCPGACSSLALQAEITRLRARPSVDEIAETIGEWVSADIYVPYPGTERELVITGAVDAASAILALFPDVEGNNS